MAKLLLLAIIPGDREYTRLLIPGFAVELYYYINENENQTWSYQLAE